MILSFLALLLQLQLPDVDFPNMASPTPYPTQPAPEIIVTIYEDDSLLNNLSTTEAELSIQATQVVVNNNQMYFAGRPILPDSSEIPTALGYAKWMTSSGGYSLFGPFAPIAIHIGILVTIAVLSVIVYYGQMLIALVYRFVMWVMNFVLKFIPGIG